MELWRRAVLSSDTGLSKERASSTGTFEKIGCKFSLTLAMKFRGHYTKLHDIETKNTKM
jgi:hypothetical protein